MSTPALIMDVLQHGAKYYVQDNDDYLLRTNLLGMDYIEKLQETGTLSFSLRAAELECENSIISLPYKK